MNDVDGFLDNWHDDDGLDWLSWLNLGQLLAYLEDLYWLWGSSDWGLSNLLLDGVLNNLLGFLEELKGSLGFLKVLEHDHEDNGSKPEADLSWNLWNECWPWIYRCRVSINWEMIWIHGWSLHATITSIDGGVEATSGNGINKVVE